MRQFRGFSSYRGYAGRLGHNRQTAPANAEENQSARKLGSGMGWKLQPFKVKMTYPRAVIFNHSTCRYEYRTSLFVKI